MNGGCLFLISAPSGAGKTSLVDAVLKAYPGLNVSISHTTRPIRPGEVDGQNYHFVSEKQFRQMVANNEFLEHATVFGNLYGTGRAQVQATLQQGLDVILEIDWQGAALVRQQMPDCVSIFILPPDEATLAARLKTRAQDSAETIAKRLAEAKLDMSKAADADYIIVNDDFERAKTQLLAVIASARLRQSHQLRHNVTVQTLINNN